MIYTLQYTDKDILDTLIFSDINEFGGVHVQSRMGTIFIQTHGNIFLVDGCLGCTRTSSMEKAREYITNEYLRKYKKLLQF